MAIRSSFPSRKVGSVVACRSTIERDLCYVLEFMPAVVRFTTRPFIISAAFSDGEHHTYAPSFLVEGQGWSGLVDCIPAALVEQPHIQRQRKIGRTWADEHDHAYALVTDQQLRAGDYLGNIKILHRYRDVPVDPALQQQAASVFSAHPQGITLGGLAQYLGTDLTALYAMLYRHLLGTEVTRPITPGSLVWIGPSTGGEVLYAPPIK